MCTTYVYEDLLSNIHTLVSFISNSPKLETSKCPSADEWINFDTYIYNLILFIYEKEQNINTLNNRCCAVLSCFSCVRLCSPMDCDSE